MSFAVLVNNVLNLRCFSHDWTPQNPSLFVFLYCFTQTPTAIQATRCGSLLLRLSMCISLVTYYTIRSNCPWLGGNNPFPSTIIITGQCHHPPVNIMNGFHQSNAKWHRNQFPPVIDSQILILCALSNTKCKSILVDWMSIEKSR